MSTKQNDIAKEHDVEILWEMMSDFERKWSLEAVIGAAEVFIEKQKESYLLKKGKNDRGKRN